MEIDIISMTYHEILASSASTVQEKLQAAEGLRAYAQEKARKEYYDHTGQVPTIMGLPGGPVLPRHVDPMPPPVMNGPGAEQSGATAGIVATDRPVHPQPATPAQRARVRIGQRDTNGA